MKDHSSTFNEKCSHTADGVAYRRTFTDIPLSQEIWEIVNRLQGPPPDEELERMKNRELLPYFEARYLMTDRALKSSGIGQALELAAGLSPRGVDLTGSSGMVLVEMDLPEKMALKRRVLAELAARGVIQPGKNLFLEAGNVIDGEDFRRAAAHFDPGQPVAVICEGLLRYVSLDDKETLGRHIVSLLQRGGGVWITPDVSFAADYADLSNGRGPQDEQRLKVAGMSVLPNLFQDEGHAQSFFAGLGLMVRKYPLSEIAGDLACPKKAGLSREQVAEALRNRCTYAMTLKG